ncbi:hypothetical protein T484DRAFT_1877430 [Baffinella frigidus]|nr:hypothetical protein T484DRAFT_1877430 [Cryptophyta sp. CCMP2293]
MAARPGSQIRLREGGSVETFDGAVDDSFLCQVCMEVFVEPTSGCPQGHACCRICYESVLASEQKKCPTCRHPTSIANLVRMRPLEDLLNKTLVKCKHAEVDEDDEEQGPVNKQPPRACKRAKISASAVEGGAGGGAAVEGEARGTGGGCTWTGMLGEVEAHLTSSCSFALLPCPFAKPPSAGEWDPEGCTELVLRRELEKHAAECEYRMVVCPHCKNEVCWNELEDHEEDCDHRAMECENEGCSVMMVQGEMDHHHREDCDFEKIACPCNGCEDEVLRRDLEAHLVDFSGKHMLGLINQNKELVNQLKQTELRVTQQVGMVAFEWSIARGWGGNRGSEVRSQQMQCGQFKICMVFSKLEQIGAQGEQFSFAVEVDTKYKGLENTHDTMNADAELRLCGGVKVPWKHGRAVLLPSNQRPPGRPSNGHYAFFSPTAAEKERATFSDGTIVVVVRVWLFDKAPWATRFARLP